MKYLVSFMLSAGMWLAASTAEAAKPDVIIPFEQANGAIFIQVVVAGRPLWFIFDTGDKYAVIDLPVARLLGLDLGPPIPVGGAGAATVTGNLVQRGDVQVAGLDGFSQPLFIALPMDTISRAEGREVAGLLGQDFIRQFVVDIDYRRHTLTLHDKAGFVYTGHGQALDIAFGPSGLPQAHARIVDATGHAVDGAFTIDTGSTGALILNTPFVAQNYLLQQGQATLPLRGGAGVGGDLQGQVGRVAALELAGFTVDKPYAVFAEATSGVFAASDVAGNIGSQILQTFKVTLDDDHGRIYLEPNDGFAAPLDYDMSGITLAASGPGFRTFTLSVVTPNTPGAAGGLAAGDRLTAIDGRPATTYSLSDLRALFSHPGKVSLTVERAGAQRTVSLDLRPLI